MLGKQKGHSKTKLAVKERKISVNDATKKKIPRIKEVLHRLQYLTYSGRGFDGFFSQAPAFIKRPPL